MINRSDSTAAADFLDDLAAGTDTLTLLADPDPDFATDFAFVDHGNRVGGRLEYHRRRNSWPIFVNFGLFNSTFYTGIGGGDFV